MSRGHGLQLRGRGARTFAKPTVRLSGGRQNLFKICSDDLMIINFDDASAGDAVAICCDSALKEIEFALRYFEILRVIQNDSDLVLTEID